MEFATEVYLNDLLLNAEANGFESAKESFYECIGLDSDIAMEGAGSTALKVVGGILLVPLILIAGVIATAIFIVGGIIALITKIIATIIKLPAIIAQAIRNKRVKTEIADRKAAGLVNKSKDGDIYFGVMSEYFEESFQNTLTSALVLEGINAMPIIKFASNKYIEHMRKNGSIDDNDWNEMSNTLGSGEGAKIMDESLNDDLTKLKEYRSKIIDSGTGFNFYVDESKAYKLVNAANKGAKSLNKFKSIIDKYEKKLKNTKAACDKAKADNSKEVSLDGNCTYMDKYLLELLQVGQVSLKHVGHAVKYVSEWAIASGREGYANKQLSESKLAADDKK